MPTAAYTRTAITLHWLVAGLICAAFPLGMYMSDLALSPLKLRLISYHKWLGVTVFLLALVRVAWRAGHAPPPLPASIPGWQRQAAQTLHFLLYLLLFAAPLSGWLMSSAKGLQTVYLGFIPLPDLIARNKVLGETLADVHATLDYALLTLVIGHIGVALKHHYYDHDGVLARMLPFLSRETDR